MGTKRRTEEHKKQKFSQLTPQQQGDTLKMARRWLGGETLGSLRSEFGYGKYSITRMICLAYGYNSNTGPNFRGLRAKHRKAKAEREAAPRPI
jgi:hypothetical protein